MKAPILGARGWFRRGLLCREDALLTRVLRGELAWKGDLAALLDDRFRKGVITVSADLPDRTGRETDARMVGSDGS